ncbi:trimethyllysine dioxygenase, mitochondrial-like isoform X2 [Ambystoma mexicanum]|uniref:trimethyllysine dioxygenase, mitochondrial-like isoform X2 n=1 Tax=Ambystoma mexicanum TaxID=8296 RepID=UPI0037E822B8
MWCRSLARMLGSSQGLLKMGVSRKVPQGMVCMAPYSSTRWHSTAPQMVPCTWNLHEDHLELLHDDLLMRFDFIWLRDHCRSDSSYNWKTNQRILDTASVNLNIRPTDVRVDDSMVYLTWPDGHLTNYSLAWLMENSYEEQQRQPRCQTLWNAEIYKRAQVASTPYQRLLDTEEGLKELLANFLRYGIAFVDGVPPDEESTELVSRRVGLIRETFYGRSWFIANDYSREDVGFTDQALDLHNDASNMQEPLGVLVFHCLEHSGAGGLSVLVDGFHAAEQVRQRNPEHFELLSTVPMRYEYTEKDNGIRMCADTPVLSVLPSTHLPYMIRYNNFDRCPINKVPHDVVRRWYASYQDFTREIRKPENKLTFKLNPGTILFIDNWRMLHGREAFTGSRKLFGYFLFRDDILNKARFLGLEA